MFSSVGRVRCLISLQSEEGLVHRWGVRQDQANKSNREKTKGEETQSGKRSNKPGNMRLKERGLDRHILRQTESGGGRVTRNR